MSVNFDRTYSPSDDGRTSDLVDCQRDITPLIDKASSPDDRLARIEKKLDEILHRMGRHYLINGEWQALI